MMLNHVSTTPSSGARNGITNNNNNIVRQHQRRLTQQVEKRSMLNLAGITTNPSNNLKIISNQTNTTPMNSAFQVRTSPNQGNVLMYKDAAAIRLGQ